jgi:hypothetical protein
VFKPPEKGLFDRLAKMAAFKDSWSMDSQYQKMGLFG